MKNVHIVECLILTLELFPNFVANQIKTYTSGSTSES